MLNQQPERGNKTRSELAIEKKDEILWFDHWIETFSGVFFHWLIHFNIFTKWSLWFGGLERLSYIIFIRVNMMFTMTDLNTFTSTWTRCNYTQSFHIKLVNFLGHTYFFYNVRVRKKAIIDKEYNAFLAKKKFCSLRLGTLYLEEFITYCGRNFIPVWDESIEPCSQYASSCPGEIKEIREKMNSTIRQTVGKKRREERIGLEEGYNCRN